MDNSLKINAYDAPGSWGVVDRADVSLVKRDDPTSLAGSLLECISSRDRRIEDLLEMLQEIIRADDAGELRQSHIEAARYLTKPRV